MVKSSNDSDGFSSILSSKAINTFFKSLLDSTVEHMSLILTLSRALSIIFRKREATMFIPNLLSQKFESNPRLLFA